VGSGYPPALQRVPLPGARAALRRPPGTDAARRRPDRGGARPPGGGLPRRARPVRRHPGRQRQRGRGRAGRRGPPRHTARRAGARHRGRVRQLPAQAVPPADRRRAHRDAHLADRPAQDQEGPFTAERLRLADPRRPAARPDRSVGRRILRRPGHPARPPAAHRGTGRRRLHERDRRRARLLHQARAACLGCRRQVLPGRARPPAGRHPPRRAGRADRRQPHLGHAGPAGADRATRGRPGAPRRGAGRGVTGKPLSP
jgi:hypothetical protein